VTNKGNTPAKKASANASNAKSSGHPKTTEKTPNPKVTVSQLKDFQIKEINTAWREAVLVKGVLDGIPSATAMKTKHSFQRYDVL